MVKLSRALFGGAGLDAAHAVAMFNAREAPPDTHFNYGGVQTEVLGRPNCDIRSQPTKVRSRRRSCHSSSVGRTGCFAPILAVQGRTGSARKLPFARLALLQTARAREPYV